LIDPKCAKASDIQIRAQEILRLRAKLNGLYVEHITGHFTDVLPTLAGITDSELSRGKNIDGEDLSAVLTGNIKDFHRETALFFYRYFHDPVCMLRKGDMILLGYLNEPGAPRLDYNEVEEALFKPGEGEPAWSQWGFQKSHMEAFPNQEPRFFELYNIKEDPGQQKDISSGNPELTANMKNSMLQLRSEMIEEGGNWFNED